MLMQMIGKLDKDQKADWPEHLQELVHVYNSMRLAVTQVQPALPDVLVTTTPTH